MASPYPYVVLSNHICCCRFLKFVMYHCSAGNDNSTCKMMYEELIEPKNPKVLRLFL